MQHISRNVRGYWVTWATWECQKCGKLLRARTQQEGHFHRCECNALYHVVGQPVTTGELAIERQDDDAHTATRRDITM